MALTRLMMIATSKISVGIARLLRTTTGADLNGAGLSGADHISRCSSQPQRSSQCQVIIRPGQLLLVPLPQVVPVLT